MGAALPAPQIRTRRPLDAVASRAAAMEALKHIVPIILSGSLAALVASIGMGAAKGDLLYVLRRPGLLGRGFVAVNIIPPLAAAVMIALFPLEPLVKLGIMLMAVSPVPPMVPVKGLKAGGAQAYAYGLYVALALLSIVVVPTTVLLLDRIYGVGLEISYAAIAHTVLTGVILPLALGVLIRLFAPRFSERAAPWLSKISFILLILAFLLVMAAAFPAIARLIGNGTVLAMAIIAAVALAAGHLLGGPAAADRPVLAVAADIRHPGIAMLIANANVENKEVTAAILLFLVVAFLATIPYQLWVKRRATAAA